MSCTSACEEGNQAAALPESLQDLMICFKSNLKSSDWLKDNTSSKWIKDNPKLAEEYLKAFNSVHEEENEGKKTVEEDEEERVEFSVESVGVDDRNLLQNLKMLRQQIDSTGWLAKQEAAEVDTASAVVSEESLK